VAEVTRYANSVLPESHPSQANAQGSPADLRGIPVVGRGIPGAVKGSRPEQGLRNLERWLSLRGEPPISRERIDIVEELADAVHRDDRRKLAQALMPPGRGARPPDHPTVPPRDL
jgi:hypothetical protein